MSKISIYVTVCKYSRYFNMKTYQAIFNEQETEGVFGISLVHDPAMEGTFVALKKENIQLKEIDLEQRILMGLVLEPNKPVYRNQNGEEFNIVFNEQTIKDLSYHFFKSNYHKNSTIEHDSSQRIEGVTFVESWIVENPKNDKSNEFGLSYPKGSWIATMKVDSDEIWNDYVKTGKVKGFSIDAMLSLKEVNLKSDINMSEFTEALNGFKNDILTALNLNKDEKPEEVKIEMGSIASANGDITFEFDGEELVSGAAVYVMAEDGTKVAVPVGEYPLEGGKVLVIEEDGIVASVSEPVQEEAPAAMTEEAPATPTPNDIVNQVTESIKSIMIKYNEEQEKKNLEFSNALNDLKDSLMQLSEQPASKKINATPQQTIELNKQGRLLQKLRNK